MARQDVAVVDCLDIDAFTPALAGLERQLMDMASMLITTMGSW